MCDTSRRCKVLEITRVKDYNTAGLAYSKLEALMLSHGKRRSEEILKKLAKADVILLDEAHILSLPSATNVKISEKVNAPPKHLTAMPASTWPRLSPTPTN